MLEKECERKYTAPISESSVGEKRTACRLTNVRNYCRGDARQCAYNSQAEAMHIRGKFLLLLARKTNTAVRVSPPMSLNSYSASGLGNGYSCSISL